MTDNTQLVNKLIKIQEKENFTDLQMAERIGCSRQLYQMTRTLRIPVGVKILKGALKAFPELSGDAYIFLIDSADKQTEKADVRTTIPQALQDRILRVLWGMFNRITRAIEDKRIPK